MKKLAVVLSIFLLLSCSAFALAPLKGIFSKDATVAAAETSTSTTSVSKETSTTESASDLSTVLEKIDGNIAVSKSTKAELNEKVDALYNDLQQALAVNKRTRFFADLGVAFGLQEKTLNYGMTGDIGLKFGCGLMIKVGAVYMIGNDFKSINWSLDGLTATATVGWEW